MSPLLTACNANPSVGTSIENMTVTETYDSKTHIYSYKLSGNDEKIAIIKENLKSREVFAELQGEEYLNRDSIQKIRDLIHVFCPQSNEKGTSDKNKIITRIVVQSDGDITCEEILSTSSLSEIMDLDQIKGIFNIIESYKINSVPQASEKYYFHYVFWIRRY